MAKTKGHGNAHWGKDETILALNLYLKSSGKVPDKSSEDVIVLSNLLRNNPFHPREKRKDSFRNPDGVVFKVQNLRAVHTKKGLTNVSKMDIKVWEEYGHRPKDVAKLAAQIEEAISDLPEVEAQARTNEDYSTFEEGRLLLKLHSYRERNQGVKKALLEQRQAERMLKCEICDAPPQFDTGPLSLAEFEAHHIRPLSDYDETPKGTTIRDLALLCANCHRLTHRLFAEERTWLPIRVIREKLGYS